MKSKRQEPFEALVPFVVGPHWSFEGCPIGKDLNTLLAYEVCFCHYYTTFERTTVAWVMHFMLSIEKYVNNSLQFDSRLSRHDFIIFIFTLLFFYLTVSELSVYDRFVARTNIFFHIICDMQYDIEIILIYQKVFN